MFCFSESISIGKPLSVLLTNLMGSHLVEADQDTKSMQVLGQSAVAVQRQARANKKELKLMFRDAAQKQQRQSTPSISITGIA